MSGENPRRFLIGCDLGTSAMKGVLADADCTIVCRATRKVDLIRPDVGQVEIDAECYVQSVFGLVGELVSQGGNAGDVEAVCLSGASGNTVLLDDSYLPIGNAISWLDTRTAASDAILWPDLDTKRVYRSAGWPFTGTFPLAHLAWLKTFAPELWRRARHFALLQDYVNYRLCGRLVADYSSATTSYLQNQEKRAWDGDQLAFIGLAPDQLSRLMPSGTVCGTLTSEAVDKTGLAVGTRLVTGSFDHPSAARSTGILNEGNLLISAGTSWVIFAPVRSRDAALSRNMLIDPFLSPSGCWGAMSALTAVAEKIHVYLDAYIASDNGEPLFERFNRLAAASEPGAGGLFIDLLSQPCESRIRILNDSQPADIARALMESIVFLTRNRLDQIMPRGVHATGRLVFTGGPTKSPVWSSILADVLERDVTIPETGEYAGAMGAVILAGIGCSIYCDEEAGFMRTLRKERVIRPDLVRSRQYQRIYSDFVGQFNLETGDARNYS